MLHRRFLRIPLAPVAVSAALGAEILVPDDHPTIQDAIAASNVGDQVIVRPGTYVESIDLLGKRITVRSAKGPSVTTIDGDRAGPVAMFTGTESRSTVLEGFTITGGRSMDGAGLLCMQSSPTIRNNIIVENSAGPYMGFGGGIHCDGAAPLLIDNIVANNSAKSYGGGIYCFYWSFPEIVNCIVAGNRADNDGGGIYLSEHCDVNIVNTVVARNTAIERGGGLHCFFSDPTAVNSLFWRNQASEGPQIWIGSHLYHSSMTISHCDVDAGRDGVFLDAECELDWGPGMIDADPLFAGTDDFHLTYDSPCRNAGTNAVPALPESDREGDPRIAQNVADIGADEFYTHLYHLGAVAPGAALEVRVVGAPGTEELTLGLDPNIQDPPRPTPYGDLYLPLPAAHERELGPLPADGILRLQLTVPPTWNPGEEYCSQGLVGALGEPNAELTNPVLLWVE